MSSNPPMNCPKCGEALAYHWDHELQDIVMSCVKVKCTGTWKMDLREITGEAAEEVMS